MTYRFIYPDYGVRPDEYHPHPDPMLWHRQHNGEIVEVLRRMRSPEEYEWLGDAMFIVRAPDGSCGEVWHSELHALTYPWPATHDENGNAVWSGRQEGGVAMIELLLAIRRLAMGGGIKLP
jgi:hypothetical protein